MSSFDLAISAIFCVGEIIVLTILKFKMKPKIIYNKITNISIHIDYFRAILIYEDVEMMSNKCNKYIILQKKYCHPL